MTGSRDPVTGKPIPNAQKFPHGMRWLSDQLHAKGLKFGVCECVLFDCVPAS